MSELGEIDRDAAALEAMLQAFPDQNGAGSSGGNLAQSCTSWWSAQGLVVRAAVDRYRTGAAAPVLVGVWLDAIRRGVPRTNSSGWEGVLFSHSRLAMPMCGMTGRSHMGHMNPLARLPPTVWGGAVPCTLGMFVLGIGALLARPGGVPSRPACCNTRCRSLRDPGGDGGRVVVQMSVMGVFGEPVTGEHNKAVMAASSLTDQIPQSIRSALRGGPRAAVSRHHLMLHGARRHIELFGEALFRLPSPISCAYSVNW